MNDAMDENCAPRPDQLSPAGKAHKVTCRAFLVSDSCISVVGSKACATPERGSNRNLPAFIPPFAAGKDGGNRRRAAQPNDLQSTSAPSECDVDRQHWISTLSRDGRFSNPLPLSIGRSSFSPKSPQSVFECIVSLGSCIAIEPQLLHWHGHLHGSLSLSALEKPAIESSPNSDVSTFQLL